MERTAIVQAFQACGGCAPVPPTLAAAGLGSLRFGCAEAAVSQAARLILRRRPVKPLNWILCWGGRPPKSLLPRIGPGLTPISADEPSLRLGSLRSLI